MKNVCNEEKPVKSYIYFISVRKHLSAFRSFNKATCFKKTNITENVPPIKKMNQEV